MKNLTPITRKEMFMAKKIIMIMPRDWNAGALRKILHGEITAKVPCSLFQNHPDAMLYETLVYYGVYYAEQVNFRAPWDKAVVIAAMAIDNEGRYSRVYRQKYTFRKRNAADIEDLFTKSAFPQPEVAVPYALPQEQEFELVKDRDESDARFSSRNLNKIKRENRIRRF